MVRRMVVIGGSLGGIEAVETLLSELSPDFPWPVVVVLHRSPVDVSDGLRDVIGRRSALPVAEAEDKDLARPGRVYVAPADYHLLVEGEALALSTDDRVHWARPSIDVLFDSAAATCGAGLVAVVLTGASADGAEGARAVKSNGGTLLVQDPSTAESPVMPRSAIDAAEVDAVLTVAGIAARLNALASASDAAPPPEGSGTPAPTAGSARDSARPHRRGRHG